MSETKFNKGVWSTSPKKNAVISTCSGGLEMQGATGEWAVAYYGGNLICESVSEDNANVIAMSTNMYRMLDYIQDCIRAGYDIDESMALQIDELLSKARGES